MRGEDLCDANIVHKQQEEKIFMARVTNGEELRDSNIMHELKEENSHDTAKTSYTVSN